MDTLYVLSNQPKSFNPSDLDGDPGLLSKHTYRTTKQWVKIIAKLEIEHAGKLEGIHCVTVWGDAGRTITHSTLDGHAWVRQQA